MKKGELSLQVVIIAVICLVVLVVVLAIFFNKTGSVSSSW